jgi:hypothetical protein
MEQDDPGRTLLESNYILLGIIAFHSATGTWMLFLSIPILGRPQTSIRLKNVLVEHFFVGAFACITAIIRIPFVLEINLLDVDYTLVPFSVWSAIECDMKMVTVAPMFSEWPPRLYTFARSKPSPKSHSGPPQEGEERIHASNSGNSPAGGNETRVMASKLEEGTKYMDEENHEISPMSVVGVTKVVTADRSMISE